MGISDQLRGLRCLNGFQVGVAFWSIILLEFRCGGVDLSALRRLSNMPAASYCGVFVAFRRLGSVRLVGCQRCSKDALILSSKCYHLHANIHNAWLGNSRQQCATYYTISQ
jgi:hypothetical protein